MELSWRQMPDLTVLIRKSLAGDNHAEGRLFQFAYPYFTRIASRLLKRDQNTQLESTDLVHDVYIRCLRTRQTPVTNRDHYLALITTAMRSELIDQARRRKALKRQTTAGPSGFPNHLATQLDPVDLTALSRELDRLEKTDRRACRVVELRYFGGCSWEETATAIGASVKVVRTDWDFAAKWLGERLTRRRTSC